MYSVTEAAQRVGVSGGTLRLWEAQGLVQPGRGARGRRTYSVGDLERLRKIAWWRRVRGLNAAAILRILETDDYASLGNDAAAEPPRPQGDINVRSLRRKAGMTLKELSEHSGLSVSFISSVERGVSGLSPTSSARLLAALQGVEQLDADQPGTVHRLGQGNQIEIAPGIGYEWLSGFTGLLEPQLAVLQPGARSESRYQHNGEEFVLVLSGSFELQLGGGRERLEARDTIHFDSQVPHSWSNPGEIETEVLWITTERGVWSTTQAGLSKQKRKRT